LLKNSDIIIDDATTTTQNNVAIRVDHQGQTNSSLVLTPEGTGAFILGPKPDGTATGGNARGNNAVDLQTFRLSGSEIASGNNAVVSGGGRNRATGSNAVVSGGSSNTASGSNAVVSGGSSNTASGSDTVVSGGLNNNISGNISVISGGEGNVISSNYSSITGGRSANANRYGMTAFASSRFAATGDCQYVRFNLSNKTTDNTPTELFLDGTAAIQRLNIPAGKIMNFTVRITGIKSDGTDQVAAFDFTGTTQMGRGWIKNVSATTSGLISGASYTRVDGVGWVISADDTLDCLKITVTGKTGETWRWIALVEGTELAYGT
jgi:hypothetical protein